MRICKIADSLMKNGTLTPSMVPASVLALRPGDLLFNHCMLWSMSVHNGSGGAERKHVQLCRYRRMLPQQDGRALIALHELGPLLAVLTGLGTVIIILSDMADGHVFQFGRLACRKRYGRDGGFEFSGSVDGAPVHDDVACAVGGGQDRRRLRGRAVGLGSG
jgi:hypothetical protein